MIETYSAKFQEDLNQAYQQGYQLGSQNEKSSRIFNYIQTAKQENLSDSAIRKDAKKWGYTDDDVDYALKEYSSSQNKQ